MSWGFLWRWQGTHSPLETSSWRCSVISSRPCNRPTLCTDSKQLNTLSWNSTDSNDTMIHYTRSHLDFVDSTVGLLQACYTIRRPTGVFCGVSWWKCLPSHPLAPLLSCPTTPPPELHLWWPPPAEEASWEDVLYNGTWPSPVATPFLAGAFPLTLGFISV